MADSESPEASEDLDLDLGSAPRKGGWGSFIAVVLIILAAVVLYVGIARYIEKSRQKEEREAQRTVQLNTLGTEIMNEIAKVEQGDISGGLKALKKASSTLAYLITEAQEAEDTEAAELLQQRKQLIDKAVSEIGKQQDLLTKMLKENLQQVGSALGGKPKTSKAAEPKAVEGAEAGTPAEPAPPAPAAPETAPPASPTPEAAPTAPPAAPKPTAPAPAGP